METLRTVILPWIREEDYASFAALKDGEHLFIEWPGFLLFLKEAENFEKDRGKLVEFVELNFSDFTRFRERNILMRGKPTYEVLLNLARAIHKEPRI